MKSISKLKDEARKLEQREEWDKAIQVYLEVLQTGDDAEGEVELPLYNRVGDLCARLGRFKEAVRHYEQAADRYAEAGLYNNAIALCNKALRYAPDQVSLLRKLGQFSASQGFTIDARRYFLEYAEKQFANHRVEEALGALADFAGISQDPEVREMLARRMHAHGRTNDAVAELLRAREMHIEAGETARAEALLQEVREMDPRAVPGGGSTDASADTGSLHDVEAPAAEDAPATGFDGWSDHALAAGMDAEPLDTLGIEHAGLDLEPTHDPGGDDIRVQPLADVEWEAGPAEVGAVAAIEGLEPTTLDPDAAAAGLDVHDFGDDLLRDETSPLPMLDDAAEPPAGRGFDEGSLHIAFDDEPIGAGWGSDDAVDLVGTFGETEPLLEAETFSIDDDPDPAADLPLVELDSDRLGDPALDVSADAEGWPDGAGDALVVDADWEHDEGGAGEEWREDAEFIAGLLAGGESTAADVEGAAEPEAWDAPASADLDAEPLNVAIEDVAVTGDATADAAAELAEAAVAEPEPEPEPAVAADAAATGSDVPGDVASRPAGVTPSGAGTAPPAPAQEWVDLGAMLADEPEETTRFRLEEAAPTGDEDRDFAELLSQFKAKVSEHVPAEDASAHYDLGLAFKEMGLFDEAIAEFQIALRAGHNRLKIHEELAHCFLQKEQFSIAEKVLQRALQMKHGDELELLGVYYHLGRAYEGLGRRDEARDAYERVLGMDINFGDVSARLARL